MRIPRSDRPQPVYKQLKEHRRPPTGQKTHHECTGTQFFQFSRHYRGGLLCPYRPQPDCLRGAKFITKQKKITVVIPSKLSSVSAVFDCSAFDSWMTSEDCKPFSTIKREHQHYCIEQRTNAKLRTFVSALATLTTQVQSTAHCFIICFHLD